MAFAVDLAGGWWNGDARRRVTQTFRPMGSPWLLRWTWPGGGGMVMPGGESRRHSGPWEAHGFCEVSLSRDALCAGLKLALILEFFGTTEVAP
jgi:hypothetical protein